VAAAAQATAILKHQAVPTQGTGQQRIRLQQRRGGPGTGFFKRILNQGLIVSK